MILRSRKYNILRSDGVVLSFLGRAICGSHRSLETSHIIAISTLSLAQFLKSVESAASLSIKLMICRFTSNPSVPPASQVLANALHKQTDACLSDLRILLQALTGLKTRICGSILCIFFCDISISVYSHAAAFSKFATDDLDNNGAYLRQRFLN